MLNYKLRFTPFRVNLLSILTLFSVVEASDDRKKEQTKSAAELVDSELKVLKEELKERFLDPIWAKTILKEEISVEQFVESMQILGEFAKKFTHLRLMKYMSWFGDPFLGKRLTAVGPVPLAEKWVVITDEEVGHSYRVQVPVLHITGVLFSDAMDERTYDQSENRMMLYVPIVEKGGIELAVEVQSEVKFPFALTVLAYRAAHRVGYVMAAIMREMEQSGYKEDPLYKRLAQKIDEIFTEDVLRWTGGRRPMGGGSPCLVAALAGSYLQDYGIAIDLERFVREVYSLELTREVLDNDSFWRAAVSAFKGVVSAAKFLLSLVNVDRRVTNPRAGKTRKKRSRQTRSKSTRRRKRRKK